MAKLSSSQRKALPKSDFAGPGRSYNAGNISKSTENAIKAKARRKLGGK